MATEHEAQGSRYYVSITGLRLTSPLHAFRFWRYAIPSMIQARRAEGNLSASARNINGVRHTLTVWRSESDMRRFLYRGAHRRAIQAFPRIGTGLTFGYESDRIPDWSEVHELWKRHGVSYERARAAA